MFYKKPQENISRIEVLKASGFCLQVILSSTKMVQVQKTKLEKANRWETHISLQS